MPQRLKTHAVTTPLARGSNSSESNASVARNDVSIGRRMRELRGQIGRHNSWDEESQPDEAEAVEDEQRLQRFGPLPNAEFRPNVSGGADAPRNEAECDADEKADLRRHEYLVN